MSGSPSRQSLAGRDRNHPATVHLVIAERRVSVGTATLGIAPVAGSTMTIDSTRAMAHPLAEALLLVVRVAMADCDDYDAIAGVGRGASAVPAPLICPIISARRAGAG